MNPYVIGGIIVAALALIALAFYMMNKQSFSGAVGPKPRATDTPDADGGTPTGGGS